MRSSESPNRAANPGLGSCEDNHLIGPVEASELLGIGQTTFKRWIDSGAIPAHRTLGGHRRVLKSDLLNFAASRGIPIITNGASKKILIIDDDAGFLKTLAVRLRSLLPGIDILSSSNAYEAGATVTGSRPDVILLDLRMPGIDGAEFCRWVRKNPGTSGIVLIGMTGSRIAAEHEELRKAGASQVLVKPFGNDKLRETLQPLFHLAHSQVGRRTR